MYFKRDFKRINSEISIKIELLETIEGLQISLLVLFYKTAVFCIYCYKMLIIFFQIMNDNEILLKVEAREQSQIRIRYLIFYNYYHLHHYDFHSVSWN